jgi:hypothetical protein
MSWSDKLIQETMRVWQPHYAEPLTRQDAEEILSNAIGYIRLLEKWDIEEKTANAGLTEQPAQMTAPASPP